VSLLAVLQAVDERLTREALERYPSSYDDARLPRHDFGKPDNADIGVSRVNEAQVRRRSQVPDCAEVYEGYVPIEYLHPVLAEDDELPQYECLSCGHIGERSDFGTYRECPVCKGDDVVKNESTGYDWSEFSPKATFPPAEVFISKDSETLITDGNHRVAYWRDHGMTHALAWVIDERPCVRKKKPRRKR
jgi:hypothetical protein